MKKMLAVLALPLIVAACSKSEAKPEGPGGPGASKKSMAFPVEVKPVESRRVEYTITAVGSLEAFERVAVKARVAGAVERVMFTEGAVVSKGQTLVEVEPQRYRLAVNAAEATLQKARAGEAEAQAGFSRRQQASEKNPGLIRGEELETWRTKVQSTAAEVAQAQAALQTARLNLHDAFVKAPVSGIIQTRTVETGQYVPIGTVLATLVRRDPLLLRFTVPEQDAMPLRPGIIARFSVSEEDARYEARVTHVAAA